MSEFRPDVEQDKKVSKMMLILPALLIAGLVAFLVIGNALYGRPNYTVGMYDTSHPVSSVSFHEKVWVPQGNAVKLDDDRMVAVDYTDQGLMMYTTKEHLEQGGGGGRPETGAAPDQYGNLYLRTRDGLYQPLVRKQ
jgi:hypothetical protein